MSVSLEDYVIQLILHGLYNPEYITLLEMFVYINYISGQKAKQCAIIEVYLDYIICVVCFAT
jgi:hypothetical protein